MAEKREKLARLANHVTQNPNDYQALISFLKMRSDQIDYEQRASQIEHIKLIKKCEEQLNEKRVSEQLGGQ